MSPFVHIAKFDYVRPKTSNFTMHSVVYSNQDGVVAGNYFVVNVKMQGEKEYESEKESRHNIENKQ